MAEYRQAFCPVCGRSGGRKVTKTQPGKPYIVLETDNFWKRTLDFDPNKPFGVIQETFGRGTFKTIGYFNPEEDIDGYFPLIKNRLLQAVKEWKDNGWISKEEIEAIL